MSSQYSNIIIFIMANLISIQDASELSGKSIQTIRRAIKAKKLRFRKSKTPQGFNYMLEKDSLCELYGIRVAADQSKEKAQSKVQSQKIESAAKPKALSIEPEDFKSFVRTMETLFAQHNEERQNFLRLINTLQEKIFVMENQLNLLKAPQSKWFQFWK